MKLKQAKACVLRVGGTNCDLEIRAALTELGLNTDVLHMNQAIKRGLSEYQMLVFPGGFSYGDYVRAGAIWGKEVVT
ncbi:MAG TPA: phosphoribosylformylglycinamidine synthase subunit PurQ, partial [Candidatus Methanomethylicus sp.]|nr:phosphoribosylformylglycinamidine synthase subunit PurQ [Candidatus Methanomethylicus sp.]